jgi:hypothetical protein
MAVNFDATPDLTAQFTYDAQPESTRCVFECQGKPRNLSRADLLMPGPSSITTRRLLYSSLSWLPSMVTEIMPAIGVTAAAFLTRFTNIRSIVSLETQIGWDEYGPTVTSTGRRIIRDKRPFVVVHDLRENRALNVAIGLSRIACQSLNQAIATFS